MPKYTLETDALYQYSVGYRLKIPNAYVEDIDNIVTQFYSKSNQTGVYVGKDAYIEEGGAYYCPVPYSCTENADTLIVYAYLSTENRALTESKTIIPVHERPEPTEVIVDPTQTITYPTISQLITSMQSAVASENSRVSAEASRVSAETSRISAETSRSTAESSRASAEEARESSETSRTTAESTRASAEALRVSAESSRASAESSRVSAESTRVSNETARETKWGNATATATEGDASADVSITETGVAFTFTIPKGDKGDTGDTGATGETGQTGATGNGISSVSLVSGTHAAGTTDTYRITFTNGQTTDFTVYNGANGEGAGDMLWENWNAQFNPQNKSGQLALSSEVPTLLSALEDDASHRTVSDTEKDSWDSKASGTHTHVKTDITDLGNASTSAYGITKLSSSTSSSSTSLAATPSAVRSAYNLANGKYTKPTDGIPKTDLASAVQTSLGLADTSIQTHQDISGKANKPTISSVTMSSSGWSNSEYSFESTYPTATYDVSIELNGDSATDEQIEAWSSAKICGSATSNKAIAKGDTPTVDIPVIIKAVAK